MTGEFTWHHPITRHTGAGWKEAGGCKQLSMGTSYDPAVLTIVLHQLRLGVMWRYHCTDGLSIGMCAAVHDSAWQC